MAVLLVLLASILLKKLRQLFILVTHQPGLFCPFGSLFWLAQIPEQIPFGVSYRCTDSICRVMTKSLHTWCCHRQVLAVVAKSGFLACAFCHCFVASPRPQKQTTPQTTPNWGPVRPPKLRGGISNWRGVTISNWGPLLLSSWPFEPCFIPNLGSVSLKTERNGVSVQNICMHSFSQGLILMKTKGQHKEGRSKTGGEDKFIRWEN